MPEGSVEFRNNREALWSLEPRLLRLRDGIRWPVTGSAVLRGWLVEQNRFACDQLGQLVTLGAAYVLMGSSQRERRPRLMVEERGPPLR